MRLVRRNQILIFHIDSQHLALLELVFEKKHTCSNYHTTVRNILFKIRGGIDCKLEATWVHFC